jgi:dihydrofolate reductase
MRQLNTSIISTIDGFYEGPGADFRYADKFEGDPFKEFSNGYLQNYGTLLFGRKTYDFGQAYWTTDLAIKGNEHPVIIDKMNDFEKVVFSTTKEKADWGSTEVYDGDLVDTVRELKARPGGDILLIGSTSLRSALLKAGLIDHIQIWYFPLILGEGNSLFKGFDDRIKLETSRVTTFPDGNMLVDYKVLNGQTFPELWPPAEAA